MTLKKVEDLVLSDVIGTGASARVYRCFDAANKEYAMKVIKRFGLSAVQSERLETEVSIMQSVKHPNVVQVHRLLLTEQRYMLLMDLISGGEMTKLVQKPLDEKTAANYFFQVAAAISYCHGLGIVHRDLKFENVLVDKHNVLKITDFGLGSVSNSPDKTFYTQTTMCGSPFYIAPEVTENTKYDGRTADRYSLGVMLYFMLSCKYPYECADQLQIFAKAREGKFAMPNCSAEAQELLKLLIQPDPAKRGSWAAVFGSKFAQKFVKMEEFQLIILSEKMTIKHKPTKEELANQLANKVVPKTIVKQEGDCCPFCDEPVGLKQQGEDSKKFAHKKGHVLAGISDSYLGMSLVVSALRQISKAPIRVVYHQFSIQTDEFDIVLFKPTEKLFLKIGCADAAKFEVLKQALVQLAEKAKEQKFSLKEVENVQSVCQ